MWTRLRTTWSLQVCQKWSTHREYVCVWQMLTNVILEPFGLLRLSQGQNTIERRREEEEWVCLCADVCFNTSSLYFQGKSSRLLFEAESISILKQHAEESWLCVRVEGSRKRKNTDEIINNVFITKVLICLHLLLILPSSFHCLSQ